MDEMNLQDIRRDYIECLIQYGGVPYIFQDIDGKGKALLVTLDTQEFVMAPFSVKTIHALDGRIGLVNIHSVAVHVSRLPKRVTVIGLRRENVRLTPLSQRNSNKSQIEYDNLLRFKHKGLLEAINNDYPSLEEALERAKEEKGTCAFDKQFAVSQFRSLHFYNGNEIGIVNEENKIILHKEFAHLGNLLGKYHEKTTRTFKEAPRQR